MNDQSFRTESAEYLPLFEADFDDENDEFLKTKTLGLKVV